MDQPDPALKPLDVDGVAVTTVGTALFALATVAAVLLRDRLTQQGTAWWIWVCVVGTLIGLCAMAYTRRRAKVYAAARAAERNR